MYSMYVLKYSSFTATTNKWNSPSKVPLKNSAIFSTTKRFEFKLMVLKTDLSLEYV